MVKGNCLKSKEIVTILSQIDILTRNEKPQPGIIKKWESLSEANTGVIKSVAA